MARKPSRHEHELGTPLTDACDGWCRAKFKRWQERELAAKRLIKLNMHQKVVAEAVTIPVETILNFEEDTQECFTCHICRMDILPTDMGLRRIGLHRAHSEEGCIQALRKRIVELQSKEKSHEVSRNRT